MLHKCQWIEVTVNRHIVNGAYTFYFMVKAGFVHTYIYILINHNILPINTNMPALEKLRTLLIFQHEAYGFHKL